ncbi:YihY/virulence factor BrkB family protein [Acetobacter fallax]|uniref:YihY family inner membrane protein n=1 Tax=Acetobacter fallax TaxID=1737473 RepID=A0ABX0K952_9PROT|nr:YihY/virulence factor BrkB family protein [Acetobacter fallax]NHO32292.1 YihY family inner membrane protein [Acetobacter fallax]NHO35852.1 YihY family inner membrane protein [Acetobacter fallax]
MSSTLSAAQSEHAAAANGTDLTGEQKPAQPAILSPLHLTSTQWKAICKSTIMALISGPTTLVAAGCAFYATLALFPAISTLISIYGLAFDVQSVATQLDMMRNLLPPAAFSIIQDRVQELVSEPHSSLTLNLLISTSIALWSASAGIKSILSALNIAYGTSETRNFFVFQALALSLTLGATVEACLGVATMVALPILFQYLPVLLMIQPPAGSVELAVRLTGLGTMASFMIVAYMILFRFGPSRHHTKWRWVAPGAIAATFIWLLVASGFSYYVANIASYGSTYGPLGAFVAIMMWFFVSAWVVLLGAEFNAEMEALASGLKRDVLQV